MEKSILDKIILKTQGQPVGDGYIDIIINPDNTYDFISEIKNAGFIIEGVSWWEYCLESISEAKFGLGGPKSLYYDGYFAEIPIEDIDHFNKDLSIDSIGNILGNKTIKKNESEALNYTQDRLWPGFWIITPEDWKNDRDSITKYSNIFKSISNIINLWDPIGLISMGAPENEYAIEIRNFLPELLTGKENAIYDTFKGFFNDAFRVTIEETNRIEMNIKEIIEKEC